MLDSRTIKSRVDQRLIEARDEMRPRIRGAFDGLLDERGLLRLDPAPYSHPLGHPVLDLPVWVVDRLGDEGIEIPEKILTDVLEISALGYLYVRAQDDWLDSASRDDPTLVALGEALLALCTRRLVEVVGDSARFWEFCCSVLQGYSESLLHTHELRREQAPVPRRAFEQLLAQSRPLVLPAAALLARADRWQFLPLLEEFVFTATAASQLFNDLTDLYPDRRRGHRSWTLDAVGGPATDPLRPETVWAPAGQSSGRVHERIDEALSYHGRSERAAGALALASAEEWLAVRRALLEQLPSALDERLLATFLERMSGRLPDREDERTQGS
ncbi:hypothetical protein ACI798_03335 [Geodermatophilus sp. SYSU D01045]